MDFIDGLPLSDGCNTILVVVFHLTKMALFIPTFHDINAEDLACIFLSQVFAKHGTPTNIISEWGKHFILQFRQSLCQLLGIKANLSTAYHPETDGQTEWVNQILEQYLRVYVNYQQDDWVMLRPATPGESSPLDDQLPLFGYGPSHQLLTLTNHHRPYLSVADQCTRASVPVLTFLG